MRRSLGIMGELEDQYDRDKKKSYSDSKYSTFIQREQNDPHVKMNKQQGDIFLQYQKGVLSREKATDKILQHALKSRRRQLFKHDDVAQQAQTPTVAQQADMYNLRTTAERKPTQKFTPSTYNNQQKTKKKKQSGSKKRRRRKIRQTESEKEKI